MSLYDYQERVKALIQGGKSVILQAPTGAGKTRAALSPFVEAFFDWPPEKFPKQAIYSVPMRILATQFFTEYNNLAKSYNLRFHNPMNVKIQTGEYTDDPKLEGDLIFATLDQTLSSVLGVPYSLSRSQSNLNVGAVLGSYLIFDEFHLFPNQAAAATLQLLRSIGKLSPFVLMTATFSQTMLDEIETLLDAKLIKLPDNEIELIETNQGEKARKNRLYHFRDCEINAKDVYDFHNNRSLAVCNTVDRAVALYDMLVKLGCRPVPFTDLLSDGIDEDLRKASTQGEHRRLVDKSNSLIREHLLTTSGNAPWVMLLHSRFEQPHRQVKEELLQALWGKYSLKENESPSLIVVATQVVEVGLDISCEVLHTELSPAASVFQRAGRCARFPGEQGRVFVYEVPKKQNGEPNFAPYGENKLEQQVCTLTGQALRERDGDILHFPQEQQVINFAQSISDRQILDEMKQNEGQIWLRITDALTQVDYSTRSELIRSNLSSLTIWVCDPPGRVTDENPFRLEGFSLHQGTLRGKLKMLKQLQEEMGLSWGLKYPEIREDEKDKEVPPAYIWIDIDLNDERQAQKEISQSLVYAIHPCLIDYDAERGLRIAEKSEGAYRSKFSKRRKNRPDYGGYRLESYQQHISRMRVVYEKSPLCHRLAWIASRLQEREGEWYVPPKLLDRAVRLTFALHDVGKLEAQWQKWAREYQEAIGESCSDFLIAHTHYDARNPQHQEGQKKVRAKKPKTHAGEGAHASARILFEALSGAQNVGLYRAAFTAIARHHSPFLESANPYRLEEKAESTIEETLALVGNEIQQDYAKFLRSVSDVEPDIRKRLLAVDDYRSWWWLYFVIVRNLRLCDGRSQEE